MGQVEIISVFLGYLTARRLQLLHRDIMVLQPGGGHAHGPAGVARNGPCSQAQDQGHPVSYLIFTKFGRKIYSTILFL